MADKKRSFVQSGLLGEAVKVDQQQSGRPPTLLPQEPVITQDDIEAAHLVTTEPGDYVTDKPTKLKAALPIAPEDRQIDREIDSHPSSSPSIYLPGQTDGRLPTETPVLMDREISTLIGAQPYTEMSIYPPVEPERKIDIKAAREAATQLSKSTMATSGLKLPNGFDTWMDDIVYEHKKRGVGVFKQDILRRGLELVYIEIEMNGREFRKEG